MRCPICLFARWAAPVLAVVLLVTIVVTAETKAGVLAGLVIASCVLVMSAIAWRMPDHAA